MLKPRTSLAWHELASDLPNGAFGKFGFITSIKSGPGNAQDNFRIGDIRFGTTITTF